MKKKLLSLVLAGAMVATTSVSAFAAPISAPNGQINGADDQEYTTNVNVTGDVQNQDGHIKPGTISVSVPTAANFTVDKDGGFLGTTINVSNTGTQDVDVYAYGFTDTNPNSGITVGKEGELSGQDRTHVSLRIQGNVGTAHLSSTSATKRTGVYSDNTLDTSKEVDEWKIATVGQNATEGLRLEGNAGSNGNEVTEAVRDNFTLVLKVKKTSK